MLRQAAEDHHGEVIDHTGDGLMLAFDSAVDAVGCAVAVPQYRRTCPRWRDG